MTATDAVKHTPVAVKPLEWVDDVAEVQKLGLRYLLCDPSQSDEGNGWYVLEETTNTVIAADGSPNAAKAAAQADYEARILSALVAPAASSQERIAQLEDELEFAAMRIENAAIHMKIVTDQIGSCVDDAMPASIVKWAVSQLLKGQSEAAKSAVRTRAALAEAAPAPEGEWKLVPVEPQPEMLAAWYRYKSGFHFHDEPPPPDTSDYGAYRAMLAAAPERIVGAAK